MLQHLVAIKDKHRDASDGKVLNIPESPIPLNEGIWLKS